MSSPKPDPIHNCPLRPFAGNGGVKSAGLAIKKVVLSSVRLIIAEGGKRKEGVWKAKRARRRRDVVWVVAYPSPCRGCAVTSDMKVRNIGRTMKQARRKINRKGRILPVDYKGETFKAEKKEL